ncbi:MAG: hypothetical protein EZS28_008416, partial [Streblomastix strix]
MGIRSNDSTPRSQSLVPPLMKDILKNCPSEQYLATPKDKLESAARLLYHMPKSAILPKSTILVKLVTHYLSLTPQIASFVHSSATDTLQKFDYMQNAKVISSIGSGINLEFGLGEKVSEISTLVPQPINAAETIAFTLSFLTPTPPAIVSARDQSVKLQIHEEEMQQMNDNKNLGRRQNNVFDSLAKKKKKKKELSDILEPIQEEQSNTEQQKVEQDNQQIQLVKSRTVGSPNIQFQDIIQLQQPTTTAAIFANALEKQTKDISEQENNINIQGNQTGVQESQSSSLATNTNQLNIILQQTPTAMQCSPINAQALYPLLYPLTRVIEIFSNNLFILTMGNKAKTGRIRGGNVVVNYSPISSLTQQTLALTGNTTPLLMGNCSDESLINNGPSYIFAILEETLDPVTSSLTYHRQIVQRMKVRRIIQQKGHCLNLAKAILYNKQMKTSLKDMKVSPQMSELSNQIQIANEKQKPKVNDAEKMSQRSQFKGGSLRSNRQDNQSGGIDEAPFINYSVDQYGKLYDEDRNKKIETGIGSAVFVIQGSNGMPALTYTPFAQSTSFTSQVEQNILDPVSFFSQFCMHHQTVSSLRDSIIAMADTIVAAQSIHDRMKIAGQKISPQFQLPIDSLTFYDTDGDFDEARNFFLRIHSADNNINQTHSSQNKQQFGILGQSQLREILNDENALLRLIICAQFSEMIASDADKYGEINNNNSNIINGFRTGCTRSSKASGGQQILLPEQNEIIGKEIVFIPPSYNQQLSRSSNGSFFFMTQRNYGSDYRNYDNNYHNEEGKNILDASKQMKLDNKQKRIKKNISFKASYSLGPGVQWDGNFNTELIKDSANIRFNSNIDKPRLSVIENKKVKNQDEPGQIPTPHFTIQGGSNISLEQNLQLKAIFSAPIIDPSEFTVIEEHSPFLLSQLLSRLMIFDPPVRTRYLHSEDVLLVAIGCAQSGEETQSNEVDRHYWKHEMLQVPSFDEWCDLLKERIARIYSPQMNVTALPSEKFLSSEPTPTSASLIIHNEMNQKKIEQQQNEESDIHSHSSTPINEKQIGSNLKQSSFQLMKQINIDIPVGSDKKFIQQRIEPMNEEAIQQGRAYKPFPSSMRAGNIPQFPSATDIGKPFIAEQFATHSSHKCVNVRVVLERVGGSVEARITAVHKRGHIFSMSRRVELVFDSEKEKEKENVEKLQRKQSFKNLDNKSIIGEFNSDKFDAETILTYKQALNELIESVPLGCLNAGYVALRNFLLLKLLWDSQMEVTYSTKSGFVVVVNSQDGQVRFTRVPQPGEGNNIFGRGIGQLLPPSPGEQTTQELIEKYKQQIKEFVDVAVQYAIHKGKEGIIQYRKGELEQNKQTQQTTQQQDFQSPYETERIIRGFGTALVRLNSGQTIILMQNGDVSAMNGYEWVSCADVDIVSLPQSYPHSEILANLETASILDSRIDADVTTRADHVQIIQHRTGERIVHHCDGTRIFHSFSFYDSYDSESDERTKQRIKEYQSLIGKEAP